MSLLTSICFVLGFFLLILGAELLVRGASRMAAAAGVPPLVIGLTVVAYGTSAPEAAVCIQATYVNPPQPDISMGNVLGSNIANCLLVLGSAAVIAPLLVTRSIVTRGLPLVLAVSLLTWAFAAGGEINRLEGLILFSGAVLYTVITIRNGRRQTARERQLAVADEQAPAASPGKFHLLGDFVLFVVGLGMLVLGAQWLVDGASSIARMFEVSELVIGLTIVAVGTSLPEVATSIVATFRGQRDIAVGNVVGSNLFNLLLVLGLCATVSPIGIPVNVQALRYDIPIVVGVAVMCIPIFYTQYRISRWEGLFFLSLFAGYTTLRYLQETGHPAALPFGQCLLFGVVPLTVIGLTFFSVRFFRQGAGGSYQESPT